MEKNKLITLIRDDTSKTEFKNLEEYITDKMCFLFQMKLNESVVAQKTGYKNSSSSIDILDWVCIDSKTELNFR